MRASILILALSVTLPTAAQAVDKKKDPSTKIICRSTPVTGSNLLVNRTCKTRAQWEADSARVSDEVLRQQQQAIQQNPSLDPPRL